jgi:DNA replication and repair protein RecF
VSLLALEVEGLRCLQPSRLELHSHVNLITGANGAGKTSLLEAIYLLGRGRSFRTRHTERLITHGAERLTVFGRTDDPSFSTIGFGYDRDKGLRARIAGRDVHSVAELSQAFSVQVVDPGIHRLVEEGPAYRRRWLDWGVFHVEPGFVDTWAEYTRSLKQRNAALKKHSDPSPWEPELVRHGTALSQARARTLERLRPFWDQTLKGLLGEPVALHYYQGWSQERSLADSFSLQRAQDLERGSTGWGAHRFDVRLMLDGRIAREVLSRGQQKVLGAALALAMARLVGSGERRPPTLLLDDPAAELDRSHTDALVSEIRTLKGQLVVTALHPEEAKFGRPDKAFHVEQGRVTTL